MNIIYIYTVYNQILSELIILKIKKKTEYLCRKHWIQYLLNTYIFLSITLNVGGHAF